ncbi:sensor histidine kinase [Halocatena halophila]|uniref:sensor histidine kinase n=1 Tax=Halocatena halophila TaxID=2814576 RepID=UPI002ED53EB8
MSDLPQRPVSRRLQRRLCGLVIVGYGCLTGTVHLYHLLGDSSPGLIATVYGAFVPFCLSVGLIVGGLWAGQRSIDPQYLRKLVVWTITGGAVFLVSGMLLMSYQSAVGGVLVEQLYVLSNVATGGSVVGFIIGQYAGQIERQNEQLDRYQQRLEREHDRYVALFDSLLNPAIQYDLLGDTAVIRVANPAFKRLFDVDSEAVSGTRVESAIEPSDIETSAFDIERALRADTAVQNEVRLKTAVGIKDFLVHVIPPAVASVGTGHLVAVDISDRKQYVRRLEVLNRVLRHDLRNDAGVIIGNTQLLTEVNGPCEYIETIRNTATDLVSLSETVREIENALDSDQRANGTLKLQQILSGCIDRAMTDYPNAEIVSCWETDSAVRILGNDQLAIAFDNVIENAIEHNDREKPSVTVTISNEITDFVTVEIADDGPGLPERERRVFNDGTESELEHSFGLGLWLVNWVVVDSGGNVIVDETDDGGGLIRIHLPKASISSSQQEASVGVDKLKQ